MVQFYNGPALLTLPVSISWATFNSGIVPITIPEPASPVLLDWPEFSAPSTLRIGRRSVKCSGRTIVGACCFRLLLGARVVRTPSLGTPP